MEPLPVCPPSKHVDNDAAQVLVVMYHYVRDEDSLPRPGSPGPFGGIKGLTTAEFNRQLDELCAALEPIDWPHFVAWTTGRADLPRRAFLLTFDDGLVDHAETVASALEARGLRGVFFVPGAVLTGHRMLCAHATHLLLAALGDEGLTEALLAYLQRHDPAGEWPAQFRRLETQGGGAPASVYDYESPSRATLKYFLTLELPIPLRTAAVDWLFEQHIGSVARWARHWYLGWDDLVRMRAAGHTIGGHGFLHEPYSRLSPAEIRQDVMRSSVVLRDGLGADLRPFSYPYGSTSGPVYDACREAGFVQAFTTQRRWVTPGLDPMQLPRFDTIHVAQSLRRQLAWSAA
jgi:peptidoglycan/xylan/chitin deacetylase (PgdA/CDA1 family)